MRGIRRLRVAAAARDELGRAPMGALSTAFGESIWHRTRQPGAGAFDGIGDAPHRAVRVEAPALDRQINVKTPHRAGRSHPGSAERQHPDQTMLP